MLWFSKRSMGGLTLFIKRGCFFNVYMNFFVCGSIVYLYDNGCQTRYVSDTFQSLDRDLRLYLVGFGKLLADRCFKILIEKREDVLISLLLRRFMMTHQVAVFHAP